MSIEIREISLGGDLRPFLEVVEYIYRNDPQYIRPLDFELKDRLSKKNPFFEHAEGAIFTAHRQGRCVGRITAQIDRLHLERHKDNTGFFGFLDTIDDAEVCADLLRRATTWLKARGMTKIRGPISLSINEETGCLVEGFDTPPMVMMPHHRAYQGGLIEQAGFTKEKDLYAWRYTVGEVNARATRAHTDICALPEVRSRPIDLKNIDRDVDIVMDIFNDAWSDNWGAVALTRAELKKVASDFRLIINPEITRIVDIDGAPAAFALALPNLNESIRDLHGKLLPTGFLKLLYRLKVRGPRTARLALLGIRKKYRHVKKYGGLSMYMYVEMNRGGARLGIKWGELSWTLEDNAPVNLGIKAMGGSIYKRYRVYQREIP